MRRMFIAAALASLSLGAIAQPYGSGGMHGGMMQGGGMMHDDGFAFESLGINDEQRARILAIQKDTRAKQWALMDQMRDLRWDTRKRIEAVLTDEQRAKFREQRRSW